MRIQRDFYTQAKRPSRGLRRGTVVSLVVHLLILGGIATAAYFFQGPPPLNIIEVGVMFAGLPDAPEGVESTKVANLPPGIPEPKPAAAANPPAEKKPDPPKEKPKEEVKPPEPKKVEPKKPDPDKKEEKKTKIAKEEEKPKPEKKPKDAFKKGDSLPDSGVDDLLEEEMANMEPASPATPGAGGLEGARPSDTAQIALGEPLAEEYGISVRGMPSILGAWANDVRRAVKRQWREPGGMPIGSKTTISFWVSRDGQLLGEPEVYEPSNDANLDQSAVTAVKLAAPFRPLPPGYNEPKQQVIFVFTIDS